MRVIPVMDLQAGTAVHAVKGERATYRPVAGVLGDGGDPLALARAFGDRLGLRELYVADLDAIQGGAVQRDLLTSLARLPGYRLLVDAGANDPAQARELLTLGAAKAIVGTETLARWHDFLAIPGDVPADRLVLSLDMRAGQVLSACEQLSALPPVEVLVLAQEAGWQEAILLDLARVGTGAGIDRKLFAAARKRCPDLRLLAGGGVRHARDLRILAALGAAGALVATALHNGKIGPKDLAGLTDKDQPGADTV